MATKPSHPRARQSGPVRLDRLSKACLGPAVARQGFGSAEILTAWSEIVGADLAVRSRPERIKWPRRAKDGSAAATLVVRAEGGDALELQHLQGEILARLNTYLGWGAVGRLVVRQAPVTHPEEVVPARLPGNEAPQLPNAHAAKETAGSLDSIRNSGLREALARLAAARAGDDDKSP